MAEKENKLVAGILKIFNFFKEVKAEMQKVSWASWQELKESTILIIISVVVLTIIIGCFDLVLSKFINLIVR